ncbi:hypothetical protein L1049_010027 [Liquidambar formosana]|uniref:Uncharacterized protein n=1 Tax=Liquidambar formosana TaxID=63359 RepID=A0AAP0R1E2_LIQFO
MEAQNKKRGREQHQEEKKTAKKRDSINFEDDDGFKTWEPCMPVGVFDFPWLSEGMISKSEDLIFEDAFSSLDHTSAALGFELSGHCLCQTPPVSDLPDHKLDANLWPSEGDGLDGVDCIWSSLLNQPLSMGFIERGV